MAAASYDGTDSHDEPRSNSDRAKPSAVYNPDGAVSDSDGEHADRSGELSEARTALHKVPEMTEERMSEIKKRIKDGYYSRSDVLDRIAKRLTRHLT